MLKWLLVAAVVAGVYFFFIKKKSVNFSPSKRDLKDSDEMVECFTCKTYCSAGDALIKESRFFCSKECMEV